MSIPSDPLPQLSAPDWREALRLAIRSLEELAQQLELPIEALQAYAPERRDFPLLVPRSFVRRMRKGDPNDPLLLQILPRLAERRTHPSFGPDPLGEAAVASDGVLEKYAHRALLIAAEACPVHCRYCFRRNFPYSEQLASRQDWSPALERLAARDGLREVILSGGDPLSLSNRRLQLLLGRLSRLPALRTLRIHTRFPVMLPERIDTALCKLIESTALRTVIVIHCNHANELDPQVAIALRRLSDAGCLLLNQSVLLQGVNASADALESLSLALLDHGVLPYYLHQLDRVAGAGHFEVPDTTALELMAELRVRLPGYLVPRLVRESPGELSKTPLS
jgi:EF-P beta-lysylation protein EpmB